MALDLLQILNVFGVGVIVAAVVQGIPLEWYRRRVERKKLRRALYAEIKSIHKHIEATEIEGGDQLIPRDGLSTEIFESNTHKLGILSEEEIKSVCSIYIRLLSQDYYRQMQSHGIDVEPEEGGDANEEYNKLLETRSKEALEVLEDNM